LQKHNVLLGQITREIFGKLCFFSVNLTNLPHFFDMAGIILISQNWKKKKKKKTMIDTYLNHFSSFVFVLLTRLIIIWGSIKKHFPIFYGTLKIK